MTLYLHFVTILYSMDKCGKQELKPNEDIHKSGVYEEWKQPLKGWLEPLNEWIMSVREWENPLHAWEGAQTVTIINRSGIKQMETSAFNKH